MLHPFGIRSTPLILCINKLLKLNPLAYIKILVKIDYRMWHTPSCGQIGLRVWATPTLKVDTCLYLPPTPLPPPLVPVLEPSGKEARTVNAAVEHALTYCLSTMYCAKLTTSSNCLSSSRAAHSHTTLQAAERTSGEWEATCEFLDVSVECCKHILSNNQFRILMLIRHKRKKSAFNSIHVLLYFYELKFFIQTFIL